MNYSLSRARKAFIDRSKRKRTEREVYDPMTVPNMITLTRIAMIPVFMWTLSEGWMVTAIILFALISLTDSLDGYLARKLDQVTDFGKVADPLADKLLVVAACLYFLAWGVMPPWAAMIILAREFIISTLRVIASSSEGKVIAAGWSGKIKTTLQMVCILFILMPWSSTAIGSTRLFWYDPAVWLMTAVTAWSGIDYLWKHRRLLSGSFKGVK